MIVGATLTPADALGVGLKDGIILAVGVIDPTIDALALGLIVGVELGLAKNDGLDEADTIGDADGVIDAVGVGDIEAAAVATERHFTFTVSNEQGTSAFRSVLGVSGSHALQVVRWQSCDPAQSQTMLPDWQLSTVHVAAESVPETNRVQNPAEVATAHVHSESENTH